MIGGGREGDEQVSPAALKLRFLSDQVTMTSFPTSPWEAIGQRAFLFHYVVTIAFVFRLSHKEQKVARLILPISSPQQPCEVGESVNFGFSFSLSSVLHNK